MRQLQDVAQIIIMSLTHQNKKIRFLSNNHKHRIHILFVATTSIQLQFKHVMKASATVQNKPIIPALFQIASRVQDVQDFVPATNLKFPPPDSSPFADLMMHREKLEAALKIARRENDAFEESRTFSQIPADSAVSQNHDGKGRGNRLNRPCIELKTTEFHLEVPSAKSVKLAADFTDWEKFPLDMIKSLDGVWYVTVPLPPGQYSYRFIVDGEWCDDPRPVLRLHNKPFGRANAVVEVA
jgi:Glycogen recognition site of AMP-activated protein kinase